MKLIQKLVVAAGIGLAMATPVVAQNAPGVTDTEIKIGQTMPYSGPVSAYGVQGNAWTAYLDHVNANGGVNGRKITLISLDDAYSPPKTLEQTRRLVERDEVAAIVGTLGSPTNMAIRKYLNDRKIPHLLNSAGSTSLYDPVKFPWTTPGIQNYEGETAVYVKHILETVVDPKIAILYANDDAGRDYAAGFKKALGDRTDLIVAEFRYETSDPTVDSQVVSLASSGANVLFYMATPKFSAQILRKKHELQWDAKTYISTTAGSVEGALIPAGLDAAQGIFSSAYYKTSTDPIWADDAGAQAYNAWMDKYFPNAQKTDNLYIGTYFMGEVFVEILRQAGDDLSRENILKVATNIDYEPSLFVPGVRFQSTPENYGPIPNSAIQVFEGEQWKFID